MTQFQFEFDPRFKVLLIACGATQSTSWVRIEDDRLKAKFGFVSLETPLSNVASAELSGPYKWWRGLGIRLSMTDRGLTFGSTYAGGVCVKFHEPVSVLPGLAHPGLTLTVSDREGLLTALGK